VSAGGDASSPLCRTISGPDRTGRAGPARRTPVLFAAAALLATAVQLVAAGSVHAAPIARVEVLVTGLDGPRGLAVVPGGVLVTESGRGGPGPCIPALGGFPACLGPTGAVTFARQGYKQRVVTGLPSLFVSELQEAIGPYDVAITSSGTVLISIGLGTDPALRPQLGPDGAATGHLVRARPGGTWQRFADIAGHPDANAPGPDRQPWGILTDGVRTFVADAQANSLRVVDRNGRIDTVPGLPGLAQPTCMARGPDGALYIGEFAFDAPGDARVLRVVPGRPPTVYATGFSNISDLTFDHSGRLLVLEYAKSGDPTGDPTGRLTRIERGGVRTELAAGTLEHPMGVAVAPDGAIYISNKGITVGGGEVLRITDR
jgi:hypothetical protein